MEARIGAINRYMALIVGWERNYKGRVNVVAPLIWRKLYVSAQ
jgi:hypothetical protein